MAIKVNKKSDLGMEPTESSLVDMLKTKDQMAMSRLYDQYSSALYGVIIRIVKSESIAELVLEQTFLKVLSDIQTFNNQTTLFAWMFRIARTRALESTQNVPDNSEVVAKLEHQITVNEYTALIEGMESQCGEVMKHMYLEGRSILETSQALSISLATVKTQLRSASTHIQGKLNGGSKMASSLLIFISLLIQYQQL